MAARSILGLMATLDGLRKLGEDITPVLTRYGIDLDHVDPSSHIDRGLELRIYTDVAAILKDPLAGLKAGNMLGVGSYGPFTMLVMTCENAWEAFRTGVEFQQLTYLFGTLRLEPGERSSALVLTPLVLPMPAFRFRVDGEVAGTWKLVRDLQTSFGLNLGAECIDMPYPKPAEAAAYEAVFGCPLHWGKAETRFVIRNENLQIRFPTADANAHRFYRAQCEQWMQQLNAEKERLDEKVSAHLALFSGSLPVSADVAAAFGMSDRTFRRQLRDEGTSFRALLDDVRYRKARLLLRAGRQPVDAIALELGFSEAAAFIHAFRRWSGQTPAAWRRQALQNPESH
jgi:AraC-like DNA-binding protein